MGGDYTRFTHKPVKRYAGVLMQQGRVQLDADWNEQIEIVRRRWEVQALDTFGPCAVPKVTTPEGFQITVAGSPATLAIGVGRLYADGLIAEVFPGQVYTYDDQPFYPDPPALSGMTGPNGLVYVDVWEREVSYIEDVDLLEKALGGVDTATRIQTVWQVKVQDTGTPPAVCEVSIPSSGGRLSSRAVSPPASDDPCILPPSGGYRGLENRLYRVEIHTPGDLATARFKWSRDNASVVSAVEEIATSGAQTALTVSRIGRDQVLRFKVDDWVEVLDDHREFMGEPGEMAHVIDVSEATRTITLDRAIPSPGARAFGATPQELLDRHTRVRRWDEQLHVDGNGLIAVSDPVLFPTGWIPLEDGVEVQFALDPVTAEFQLGDYWVFAARTADASVEELLDAPPRGIVHHYCPLATLTGLGPVGPLAVTSDCRHLWPPEAGEGCCTVIVQVGESIQAALDALPTTGGCVCLRTGIHSIVEPIRIETPNVLMHGESPGTRVVRNNGVTMVSISDPAGAYLEDVIVDGIEFEVAGSEEGDEAAGIVVLDRCRRTTLSHCGLEVAGLGQSPVAAAIGVLVLGSEIVGIRGNRMYNVLGGVRVDRGSRVFVIENDMEGPTVTLGPGIAPLGEHGVILGDGTEGPCRVERNSIVDYSIGIRVGVEAERSTISGNEIRRPVMAAATGTEKLYGIDVAAADCVIVANHVNLAGPVYGGIRATGADARIDGNALRSTAGAAGADAPLGIFIGPEQVDSIQRPDHALVRGNLLSGRQDGILLSGVEDVSVTENQIHGVPAGVPRIAVTVNNANGCTVASNRIRDAQVGIALSGGTGNQIKANELRNGESGVLVTYAAALRVFENVVENMQSVGLGGVVLLDTAVAHNRVSSCGYSGLPAGIAIYYSFGDLCVESCEVFNTGRSPDGTQVAAGASYGIAAFLARSCRIGGNRVAYKELGNLDATDEHRALLLLGQYLQVGNAAVLDNLFTGIGFSHLVEIQLVPNAPTFGFENVTFNNNHCDHMGTLPPATDAQARNRATVSLWGQHLITMGNHVKANLKVMPSINFNNLRQVALVGNVTTGGFINLGSSVPTPAANFNVQV